MKKSIIIILLIFGFQAAVAQMIPNNDCHFEKVKSSSKKNGIVKKNNGEIVSTKETITQEINPCDHTVTLEINNKIHDLVLYKTDKSGTINAATLNGKQIIQININEKANEVETQIGDLIFITYIDNKKLDSRPIASEE